MSVLIRGILIIFLILFESAPAFSEPPVLLRIGTGGSGGNYYPVGNMLADIVGNPLGGQECLSGIVCGVPGVLAVAQISNGSVANVKAIMRGDIEAGFVQSDIFYLATQGLEMFEKAPAAKEIAALASLYPEQLQLVVRRDAGIESYEDLKGKRVSLDLPGSGTLVDALIVLKAHGLRETDLNVEYNKSADAVEKMLRGDLDAFFIVAGHPVKALVELSRRIGIDLIGIAPEICEQIVSRYPFLSSQSIPAGVYENVSMKNTVGVSALWVARSTLDQALAYNVTKAFWEEMGRRDYTEQHPLSTQMTLATALTGTKGKLHSGARKFYLESGLRELME